MSGIPKNMDRSMDEEGGVEDVVQPAETPRRKNYGRAPKWNPSSLSRSVESKSEESSPLQTYLACSYEVDVDYIVPPTPTDLCDREIHVQVGHGAELSVSPGRKISVSNFALGMRSPVFRRLLSAESGFAESGRDAVVVHIPQDQVTGFEVMVRLLHVPAEVTDQHLNNIIWPKLLIQLIIICDRFRVMDLMSLILDRYSALANTVPSSERKKKTHSLFRHEAASQNRRDFMAEQSLDLNDIDDSMSDIDTQDEFGLGIVMEEQDFPSRTSVFSRNRPPNDKATTFSSCSVFSTRRKRTTRHNYSGMEVDQLVEILNLSVPNNIGPLQRLLELTAEAVCNRFSQLKFNNRGVVDQKFRSLPATAVKLILEENQLCAWNENDVFLAACQWVNNERSRHLTEIAHGIRFHCMDAWFLSEIVSRHEQIVNSPHLYDTVVECLRVASLNVPTRKNLICKFLEDKLRPRRTPSVGDSDAPSPFNGHNGVARVLYSPNSVQRRLAEYDTFEVTFSRNECVNLDVNSRVTSRYLVWRGVTFAIDLVRKQSSERAGETVGVFLYCQGLVCTGKIMVRYGIQTVNHQHQLTCSDYKCMHLNFRRGNGSRDFFQCDWDSFLNTYFENSKLVLRVVFLAIE